MSFRKIYIALFFAFCFISVSLKAMNYIKTFVRWPIFVYTQQKLVTSYYEFKKRQVSQRQYSTSFYDNYFSLFTYFPKLYVTIFRHPKISQRYFNHIYKNHPAFHAYKTIKQDRTTVQNSTKTTQRNTNLEQPQTTIVQPISFINLLDNQDMQSVELINQLMDIQDTTKFKKIAENFLQLQELNQNYQELAQLMNKQVESPNTTTFVENLKQLAKDEKLPPQFGAAFEKHRKKIESMGNWEYYTHFAPIICKKF